MRPAFRRGWEGEGKPESMPWRGPAGHARHTGVSIPVWEREGEALGVHAQTSEQRRSGAHRDVQRITNHGALATARRRRVMCRQAECTTRPPARSAAPPSKRARVRRSSGKKRGECTCGSAQRRRALRSANGAGQSASVKPPAHHTRSRSSPGWAGTTGPVRASG